MSLPPMILIMEDYTMMMKDYKLHMIDDTSLSWGHDDIYEPRSLDEETKQK